MPRLRGALFPIAVLLVVLMTQCSSLWQRPPQAAVLLTAPRGAPSATQPIAAAAAPTRSSAAPTRTAARPTLTATPLPTSTATATLAPTRLPGQLAQVLDQYLESLVAAELFHGAVLVARDGQIVLDKGYGMADAGRETPNTTRTRFRLASLTKQFTAAAIMLLQARGKLDVGAPICV
jgi:CubicO group peptidase (beta-lactamase class C family)